MRRAAPWYPGYDPTCPRSPHSLCGSTCCPSPPGLRFPPPPTILQLRRQQNPASPMLPSSTDCFRVQEPPIRILAPPPKRQFRKKAPPMPRPFRPTAVGGGDRGPAPSRRGGAGVFYLPSLHWQTIPPTQASPRHTPETPGPRICLC